MSKNVRTQLGKVIGKSLNGYHARVKPKIDELKFKEQYQGRIIDCMVGEVDDNYIETPETDSAIVKLEHSKEGLVKVPSIKGKTILVDADGNETDTPAEGCRLVSVGEEEDNKLIILSKNKNLVEKNKIIKGSVYWGKDYNIFTDEIANYGARGAMFKECIKVEPNTAYYIQYETDVRFHFIKYDKNGNHIIGHYPVYKNQAIRTDSETHYINIHMVGGSVSNDDELDATIKTLKETFMIEKTNVKNSFVEHKSHKTEILLNEPLRSLPNGVCDEIVGNQLIRRVGSTIINGQGNFSVQSLNSNNKVLCDYSVTPKSKLYGNQNCVPKYPFGIGNMSTRVLKLTMDITEDYAPTTHTQAREIFKKHYTENPMEVLYELEEPIIEELPNSITIQGFDDTTMYIENSITPTVSYGYNALIPYKQELLNQKEEVETNTLDIENNIIPYLMDMEFNLMLMEDNE